MVQTLWSWGANSHGQLALGLANEQIDTPTKVEDIILTIKIKKIACGGGHTLLIDNEGKLYSCGWNTKLQLARQNEAHSFERTWDLSGINFKNIACGWDFSCGITDDFLFVWGSNAYGQLGIPTIPKNTFSECIKPIRLPIVVTMMSMGLRHTAIVNSKGQVWTTGYGKHGQLGLGQDTLSSDRFKRVMGIDKISKIACGQNHTFAWSPLKKTLYVWGDNKHGQLLISPQECSKKFTPEKIDIGWTGEVKKLLSGWTHGVLWLDDGTILSWGRNNFGQLGTEMRIPPGECVKILLPDGRKPRDIAVGSEHTICLATDNTLWAWGWNEHCNTGTVLGNYIRQPTLVPLKIDINSKITLYAGGAHNFIVVEDLNDKNVNKKQL